MDKLEQVKQRIDKFNKDRDWDKFHSPSNLAKSISIEANELLECFQWNDNEFEIYCDSSSSNGSLSINIRNLCNKIVWTFEHALRTFYFEENKLPYLNVVEYEF